MSPPGGGREKVDLKAAVKPQMLTIKVVGQEKVVHHTMRMTDKLKVLMDVWYHKVPNVTYGTGVFLYDGLRVRRNMTPVGLEMEDGDMLDFFEHMDGGAGPFIIGSM